MNIDKERATNIALIVLACAILLACVFVDAADRYGGVTRVTLTPAPAILTLEAAGDTAAESADRAAVSGYVLNLHTGRFHLPGCASVGRIADLNRCETNETREELLAQGFEPCGSCKP